MRSRNLIQLDKRYRYLRRRFLPRNFSKTGSYSDDQYTEIMAFKLLFHAELETYLESLAKSALQQISAMWDGGRYCRGSVAIMTLFKSEEMHGMPTQKAEFKPEAFVERTRQACEYKIDKKIRDNKGIRSANLLAMFIPLGLDETTLDEQLLIDLTTFGSQRGEIAHNALYSVINLPDPREEKVIAERIIIGLALLEVSVANIML